MNTRLIDLIEENHNDTEDGSTLEQHFCNSSETRGQFHQRSTRSFYASSLPPVEYKAKM
jgi:hypothetical protein